MLTQEGTDTPSRANLQGQVEGANAPTATEGVAAAETEDLDPERLPLAAPRVCFSRSLWRSPAEDSASLPLAAEA